MDLGWETKTMVVAAVLLPLWLGEAFVPFYKTFRGGAKARLGHGAKNLGFGLFNSAVLLLLVVPIFAAIDSFGEAHGVGLFRSVALPLWVEVVLLCVLFDAWMYAWHRANHEVRLLWRFHRVHHSDPEMDASTGVRFHTGEVLLSALARLAVLPLLGMNLWQLALYELVLLPVVLFHHSNVSFPRWLDHGLLIVIVTPAMHRVHHSRRRVETDSNYGSVFPYWDYLVGSFRLRRDAHTINLGLDGMDSPRWQSIAGMLTTPLAPVGRISNEPQP